MSRSTRTPSCPVRYPSLCNEFQKQNQFAMFNSHRNASGKPTYHTFIHGKFQSIGVSLSKNPVPRHHLVHTITQVIDLPQIDVGLLQRPKYGQNDHQTQYSTPNFMSIVQSAIQFPTSSTNHLLNDYIKICTTHRYPLTYT